MQATQTLITMLVASSAALLMVQAGVAKRRLSWKPVTRRLRRNPRNR